MDTTPLQWMITGANGNLGKRLISKLLSDSEDRVVAVVRSASAEKTIRELSLADDMQARLSVVVLDYTDVAALHGVAEQCQRVVHLVGILKQTKYATYEQAHEESTGALIEALERTPVTHLTYMSIVGSRPDSDNACLASKGRAEALCREGSLASCVLRVPMVLGEGDYASYALSARAKKSTHFTFRPDSLEQPIYAGDVVAAIVNAGRLSVDASLDLGGPEVLTRRALTDRAAAVLGTSTKAIGLPIGLGLAMASTMELLFGNPPVTRAMLDVLDHDDDVDTQNARNVLQLSELTSLDEMLQAVLKPT